MIAVMDELQRALGDSVAMRSVAERLQRIVSVGARRLPPMLIEGETGTGKSFLAATLHRASARASEPFVSVNCAAIPRELLESELFGYERGAFTGARGSKPGLFEIASGGTLFLDEIGFLGEALQAKLLTVLEQRSVRRVGATRDTAVDLWIMAATNADLRRVSREGGFLDALFHRLAVVTVRLPPLRERGDDTLALADKLLARACSHYEIPPKRLSDDARSALRAYSFPGNVRELGNIMERVALLQSGQLVTRVMLELPSEEAGSEPAPTSTDDPTVISSVLRQHDWNISRAAAHLGIPRSTLRSRIARHGLTQAAVSEREAPLSTGPRRIAILEILPGTSIGTTSALEIALDVARNFGAHFAAARGTSGRAIFELDRFEDGARAALAAADAVGRALAPHVANHHLMLHAGRFAFNEEQTVPLPTFSALTRLPDGLLLSDAAVTLVRRSVESEHVGHGWHRIVRVTLASAESQRVLASFVGRKTEVALLRQCLDAAKSGNGQLVGIQGDAGIGKSRLLLEALSFADANSFTRVEGACIAHGHAMPYLPIREIVRAIAGADETDDAFRLTAKLDTHLEKLAVDGEVAQPLLRLLGVNDMDSGSTPEGAQAQIRGAVVAYALAAAREKPLLVVIEDVQWIDGASRDLLDALAQEVSGAPIALIATYRSGAAPSWMNRSPVTQLALQPLSRAESAELAGAVVATGSPEALQETVCAIVERAEGNPFFIEELALTFDRTQGTSPTRLPESIVDVVSSRVGALGAGARRVLAAASIGGRTCPLGLLRSLLPNEPELDVRLEELSRAELVHVKRSTGAMGERVVVFRHAATQQVAYDLQTPDERRKLHGMAARALENGHAGRLDEVIELVAHHHARGDDPERAIDVLSRAVVKAVAANALDAARADYDEAVRILDTLPATLENRRRRVQLHVGEHIVPLYFLRLEVDAYLALLEGLESEARALDDPALLGMLYARKGHCLWWVCRLDESIEASDRALATFESRGLPVLAVYTFLLQSLYAKGELQKVVALEGRALEVLTKEHDLRWTAYTLGVFAWSHARLGHFERALAIGARVVDLARARNDASVASYADWCHALVLLHAGKRVDALAHARRAAAAAPTPADRVWAESVVGDILCRSRETAAEGVALLAPLVDELRRSNLLSAEELFVPALGEAYVHLGRLDEGRRIFEELLLRAERHGMRYLEAVACAWLATIGLLSDSPREEDFFAEREQRLLTELGVPPWNPNFPDRADSSRGRTPSDSVIDDRF